MDVYTSGESLSQSETDSADTTEEDVIMHTTVDDDGGVARKYSQLVGKPDVELPMHPADYPIPYCRGGGHSLVPVKIDVCLFKYVGCGSGDGSESDNTSEHPGEPVRCRITLLYMFPFYPRLRDNPYLPLLRPASGTSKGIVVSPSSHNPETFTSDSIFQVMASQPAQASRNKLCG